jgi:hypothetical protein
MYCAALLFDSIVGRSLERVGIGERSGFRRSLERTSWPRGSRHAAAARSASTVSVSIHAADASREGAVPHRSMVPGCAPTRGGEARLRRRRAGAIAVPPLCLVGPRCRRFGRLVGRDQHTGGRRLRIDQPQRGKSAAVRKETASRTQYQGGGSGARTRQAGLGRMSDWTSSPLPKTTRSFPGCSLSLVTASAASPSRSVELRRQRLCS